MESLKGSLLIASPGLVDPNFARTVVFLAEHNAEGALGLILNRPADVKVQDLWAGLSSEAVSSEQKAFSGGPVQKNAVLLLHGHEDLAGEAEPIVPGVYLGSEVDLLGELLRREAAAGETPGDGGRFRVFCGYAGWGAGQLDAEMRAGGWITLPGTAEHVFEMPPQGLWNTALNAKGGVYQFFALMPPDPELN